MVTYNVVVRVDNRDLLLKPGMTANVTIQVRKFEDALIVGETPRKKNSAGGSPPGMGFGGFR